MIRFMVISGERSGSAWAANWLTTDTTLCLHDPLLRWGVEELDEIYPLWYRRIGVACTALSMYPDWVNAHPAKKVILHRREGEIEASWWKAGITRSLVKGTEARLQKIRGLHVGHTALFQRDTAEFIADTLGVPFDLYRHNELVQLNVQTQFAAQHVTKRGCEQLVDKIRKTLV